MIEIIIIAIVAAFVLFVIIDLRKNSINHNTLKKCTKCGTLQKSKCIQTIKSKIPLKQRKNNQKFRIVRTYKCSKCSSTFEISSLVLLGTDLDSYHTGSFDQNHHTHFTDNDTHHHDSGFSHDGGFDGGHD